MADNSDPTKPTRRQARQTPGNSSRATPEDELLARGEAAARAGQRSEARRLFRQVLALDPSHEAAWLWLAYLAPSPQQSRAYLQEALNYHPESDRVRQALAWAKGQSPPAAAGAQGWPALQADDPVAAAPRHGSSSGARTPTHAQPTATPRSDGPGAFGAPGQSRLGGQRKADSGAVPTASPPSRSKRAAGRPARRYESSAWASRGSTPPPMRASAVKGRAMARRPDEQRPVRMPPVVVATALASLVLLAALAAFAWRARSQSVSTTPPAPTSWLALTPSADMAVLRDQASQAISRQAWEQAIPLLESMRQLSPDDDGVRQQLAVAHLRFGLQLVEADRFDEAIAHYDAAIRLYANDMDLQTARRLAVGYRDGRQAVNDQRWEEAQELLEPVYKLAPGFRNVSDLLFIAYLQQARQLESGRNLVAARAAYARAVAIKPGVQEAQAKLAEITAILTPPTPTPTPKPAKRIVVDVSQQRLRAYENDRLVYDWVCSTGGVATPTQYGEYQILDKIPEAWSSVWGLRMPYWMGIYWAGGSENGIHALPILRNGKTLWAGYLGTRISYGCIVLDTPKAATLFKWAEIGTPVIVTE